jgi:hypothetical protein
MNFKKNKYTVIKKVISKELSEFLYNYLNLKKQVARTCFDSRHISQFETMLGVWNDPQAPETYSCYADFAMETLLIKCHEQMEKITGLKLYPAYSYTRMYKKGDVLDRHKDRFSCEISTTMNLGGDNWPIYLDPTNTHIPREDEPYKVIGNKGTKINLNPGDMLIYSGCALEHWREKFTGNECAQVFLHYNDRKTKGSKKNMFDTRPHLGLPEDFKKDYPWK